MNLYIKMIVAVLHYATAYIRQLPRSYANMAPLLLLIHVKC